ncbi:hypothetical protein C0583_06470 [Candidatus Parcubacteria bacterium]|nr:MAG: hypothetical protein C0583_06470 [Candidatus Parcubacteria bacterium]
MKKLYWILPVLIVVSCMVFAIIYRLSVDEFSSISFNNFPSKLKSSKKTVTIELEIAELLESARFSRSTLKIEKSGWITIGVINGLVGALDPQARISNPMSYLLFEIPGKKGKYRSSELIETPVEPGLLKISFNKQYFENSIYSIVVEDNKYKYGKITLGINYNDITSNLGSNPEKFVVEEGSTDIKTANNSNKYIKRTKDFLNVGARLKESIKESNEAAKKIAEEEMKSPKLETVASARKFAGEHVKVYEDTREKFQNSITDWGKRRLNDLGFEIPEEKSTTSK